MLYKNAYIFSEQGFFHGSFCVEGDRFAKVITGIPEEDGIDLCGAYVIPGLMDIHIHGAVGFDFCDNDPQGLANMAAYLAKSGVTSFLGTSATASYETLETAYRNAAVFQQNRPETCARLMGIHMEGPFFSEKKKGAQNPLYLKKPDYPAFQKLQETSNNIIRIADVAPELDGAIEFIHNCSADITVSVAHTNATYEEAAAAFQAGATHLTHLFNCMPSLHHRNPGVIPAAAEREQVFAELISDGHHVHPAVIRTAFKLFPQRICLISDGLCGCGLEEGIYSFTGQRVIIKDGIGKLEDGTISGAVTNVFDGMRNAISFGIPVVEAILSATIRPAIAAGCDDQIGSIESGKFADFLICDAQLNLQKVFLGGIAVS